MANFSSDICHLSTNWHDPRQQCVLDLSIKDTSPLSVQEYPFDQQRIIDNLVTYSSNVTYSYADVFPFDPFS